VWLLSVQLRRENLRAKGRQVQYDLYQGGYYCSSVPAGNGFGYSQMQLEKFQSNAVDTLVALRTYQEPMTVPLG
jgi:hypothetical protein